MASSLPNLVVNLAGGICQIKCKHGHDNKKCEKIKCKHGHDNKKCETGGIEYKIVSVVLNTQMLKLI